MAYATTKSTVAYILPEVTQGTPVGPTLGSQAIAILSDGFELNGEKELIERSVLTSSIAKQIPRTGIKTATCAIGCEWKANGNAGAEAEYGLLMESALGSKHSISTEVTTKATGNTVSTLEIEDADIASFKLGDIIMIKEAGDYWVTPITAISDTAGSANITVLRTRATAFSNSVKIEKVTMYSGANSGHKYITLTGFLDDAVKMQASGNLVSDLSVESFSVGQIPTLSFSLQGINYAESLAASGLTASYDSSMPPICLSACVYMNDVAIPVTEISLSVSNTIGRVTSTCSPNGIISTRVTERVCSGSFVTYQETDSVEYYTKFNTNAEFSMFAYAGIPTSTAGEYKDIVAFFLPTCVITAQPLADADGIATRSIDFSTGYSQNYLSDVFMASI